MSVARGMTGATGTHPDLTSLLADREIVVCCGAGGVGKTTVSAALGIAMVAAHRRRVLVLTVDPARRLATALGLTEMGVDPVTVRRQRLRRAGIEPRGTLVAAMLDMKSTWDRMIERHAPSPAAVERIFANPFYQSISTSFTGSQEYAAMETLAELHDGGEYDMLIIDTPPSRSALDFLEAPNRFSDFVGGRLLSWLARPSRAGWRALNLAASPFLRVADRLLGSEVLRDLGDFVQDVQQLYGGVQERAREVYALLRDRRTAFVVVTTFEPQPFAEAEFFCSKLREYRMPLASVVTNRVLPAELLDEPAAAAAARLAEDRGIAGWLGETLETRVPNEAPRRIGAGYLTLHGLARRNHAQVERLSRLGQVPIVRLPLIDREVADVEGLARLARGLSGGVDAWD